MSVAHISFLPLSASEHRLERTAAVAGDAPYTESTVHKLTSDPRYIVRISDIRYPDGRRARSTVYLERASGEVIDRLDLASEDNGRSWRVTAKGRGQAQ